MTSTLAQQRLVEEAAREAFQRDLVIAAERYEVVAHVGTSLLLEKEIRLLHGYACSSFQWFVGEAEERSTAVNHAYTRPASRKNKNQRL